MNDHTTRKHARFSPSGSKRAIMCPGSIRMQEGIKDKPSIYADEGTAAHTLAEYCVKTREYADAYVGQYVNLGVSEDLIVNRSSFGDRSFLISDEMAEGVALYHEVCETVINSGSKDTQFSFENWVDLSHISGMEGGTADFIAYDPESKKLTIIDLKYGMTPVYPKENTQLLCYALGAANRHHNQGVGDIELIVVQPRIVDPVKRWVTNAVELLDFEVDLAKAALATEDPQAPLNAGEWCAFCKAEAVCPAKELRVIEIAGAEFGEYDETPIFQSVTDMTPERMARVLRFRDELTSWIKRVSEYAHDEALRGRPPTGFKLVAGRATRKWTDEAVAAEILAGKGLEGIWTEPKLLSPAQIEPKMPGKNKQERSKALEFLVSKESSKVSLVPEEDARPAISAGAEEFND